MSVNLKGAAQNAYDGVKELVDFLESAREHYSDIDDLLDDAEALIVRNQPLLACYCINQHFNGNN